MIGFWKILRLIWEGFTERNIDPAPKPDPVPPAPAPPNEEDDPDPNEFGPATTIVRAMNNMGYTVYDDNEKDYNLNIVGVRDTGARLDEFSCSINVFWKQPSGEWKLLTWNATTFPGSRYLIERLLNSRGAAILCPGQYRGYRLDTHNGKYEALCQRGHPVRVFRDGDRDREFDLVPSSVQSGMFGINIHAPVTPSSGMSAYVAGRVYAASAGCQVFRSVADFLEFRSICREARNLHGNSFTYTLLEDTDLHRVDVTLPSAPPDPDDFDDLEEWNPDLDTAGIRNKNPLNVKGEGWKYSRGQDSRGHNIFPSFPKGLRAGIITLRSYWMRHKRRTIADILARWAPATDTIGSLPGAPPNSPKAYSLFVASRMDHKPTAPLSLFHESGSVNDEEQLYHLVAAMAAYENDASLVLPREVFERALQLL